MTFAPEALSVLCLVVAAARMLLLERLQQEAPVALLFTGLLTAIPLSTILLSVARPAGSLDWTSAFVFAASGASFALANLASEACRREMPTALFQGLYRLAVGVAIVLSAVLLHETPGPSQIFGVILSVSTIVLAPLFGEQVRDVRWRAIAVVLPVAIGMNAVTNVVNRFAVGGVGMAPELYLAGTNLTGLGMAVAMQSGQLRSARFTWRTVMGGAIAGVLNFLSFILLLKALHLATFTGSVLGITGLAPVAAVVLSTQSRAGWKPRAVMTAAAAISLALLWGGVLA